MLVDTGFNPDDAMIVRFDRTVPGIDAAVAACFTAADVPAETPPHRRVPRRYSGPSARNPCWV